jgi:hypothetical protein
MKKVSLLFTAALLTVSVAVFAYVAPPPGGKFCKNNPTTNTGTCTYSGNQVESCLTTLNAIKDCYGIGSD